MRIEVSEEEKSYLLPFKLSTAKHVINKGFICKEDIPYVKFVDIAEQFKVVKENPNKYLPEIVQFVNELEKYITDEVKTQEYLYAYFMAIDKNIYFN